MKKQEYNSLYMLSLSNSIIILYNKFLQFIKFHNKKVNIIKQLSLVFIGLLLSVQNLYSQNIRFEEQIRNQYQSLVPNIENKINNGFLENNIFKHDHIQIQKRESSDSTSLIDKVIGKLEDGSQFQYKYIFNYKNLMTSKLYQTWDGSNWVNKWRDTYTYDSNGNNTSTLQETWDNNQWVNSWHIISTYDSNGNYTSYLFETWKSSQWVGSLRVIHFTFDSEGNMTSYILEEWDGSNWMNSSRNTYTYDSNGNNTSVLSEMWDSQWVNSMYITYTYDSNGNLTLELYETWDGSQWVNDRRTTYTFDSNGNQTLYIYETWDNNQWTYSSRNTYTYDSNGNLTLELYETWDGSQWVNNLKNTYKYDPNNNQILWLSETWDGSQWVNYTLYNYTYDFKGNMILGSSKIWDNNNWKDSNGNFHINDSFGKNYYYYATEINISYRLIDIVAPVITHTPIENSEANQSIIISANITDNNYVTNAKLFYRKKGENNFISVNMTANGDTYNGEIPSSVVTTVGLEYYLTATDSSGNEAREPTVGVFSIQVYVLDVEAPVITHTPVENSETNQSIIISANITDNNYVTNAKLFYRKGGENNFISVNMTSNGNTYSGEIPSSDVTLRGLEYYITAEDTSNNVVREPTDNVFSILVNITGEGLVKATPQPSGSAQTAYRLISIPLDVKNKSASSIFQDDLGSYDETKWRLFTLEDDQTYDEYSSSLTVEPGTAYWLIVKDPDKRIDTGPAKSFKTNGSYAIPINAGWTFIGTPFNYSIPLDHLTLSNGKNFSIEYYSGSWTPLTNSLQPFEGYAIHSENKTELLINPILGDGSSLPKKVNTQNNKNSKPLWTINIKATCQDAKDLHNEIAILPGSSEDWDYQDRPEPPIIGEYISLYFPHFNWNKISKIYSKDVRPEFEDGEIWEIEVLTNIKDLVKLSFENLKEIPENFEIILIDQKNQTTKNLLKSPEYSYTSINDKVPRKLKLIIGKHDFIKGVIEETIITIKDYQLFQNYPNPFNPTTVIKYSIPDIKQLDKSSNNVTLKVYDVLGKEVVSLVNKLQQSGNYEVIFNATNLPSGVYFYRLKSGQFHQTKKMILMK